MQRAVTMHHRSFAVTHVMLWGKCVKEIGKSDDRLFDFLSFYINGTVSFFPSSLNLKRNLLIAIAVFPQSSHLALITALLGL